jgi:hypothetical protein
MNGFVLRIVFFFSVLFVSQLGYGSSIDKGYKALSVKDYFKAKKYFTKGLKYHTAAASQGLSIIYYRNDNPFHNYDSAFAYIQSSLELWEVDKERKKEKWFIYGYSKDSIIAIRDLVSTSFYQMALADGSVESLTNFSKIHPWAKENSNAIAMRDSLAFFEAVTMNNSEAYLKYVNTYPESNYRSLAQSNYFDSQFEEITISKTTESFSEFIQNYPNNPLVEKAEKSRYILETKEGSKGVYMSFIEKFPSSSYKDTAWIAFFQKSIDNYTEESINEFLMTYPESPAVNFAEQELVSMNTVYFPVTKKGKYGFMTQDGVVAIEPIFDNVSFYKEGFVVCSINDKFGVISKRGITQIDFEYSSISDFQNGFAVAEKEEKFGLLDRNGKLIMDCIYSDLSLPNDGFVYAQLGGKYGFYNIEGKLVIPHIYDDVYSFESGIAKVIVSDKEAFISKEGEFVVEPNYSEVERYSDSIFVFNTDDYYGLINSRNEVIVEPVYDEINQVVNGLALAVYDNQVVYLDNYGRRTIDNDFQTFPNYRLKGEFSDSIAIAMKDEKYVRINMKGQLIGNGKFENVGLGRKYFPVQMNGKWGLMGPNSKLTIPTEYSNIHLFDDKYVLASKEDTLGVYSVSGKKIVPFIFEDVIELAPNIWSVKQNNQFGVYNAEQLIAPIKYQHVGVFNEEYLFLIEDGEWIYQNILTGSQIQLNKNE